MIPETFERNRLLRDHCTIGIGGPAKYFVEVRELAEMQRLLTYCYQNNIPYFILGKGSNTLFDDKGFGGLVIANRIDFLTKEEPDCWHVGAGYSFSLLGTQTAREGLSGLEFASGIPGSVGGAVYMNAGANGRETCESLLEIDYITEEGEIVVYKKSAIEFGYRFSSFQNKKGAIVGSRFKLTSCAAARENQFKILDYRKKTQPYGEKSAGCVFRNPQCNHAGALIDQSGLKGLKIGGAQVSTVHANFIINTGNASAEEVLSLIGVINKTVYDKTGIQLESEVRQLPYSVLY